MSYDLCTPQAFLGFKTFSSHMQHGRHVVAVVTTLVVCKFIADSSADVVAVVMTVVLCKLSADCTNSRSIIAE